MVITGFAVVEDEHIISHDATNQMALAIFEEESEAQEFADIYHLGGTVEVKEVTIIV